MNPHAKAIAPMAALGGVCLVFYGWYFGGFSVPLTGAPLYKISLYTFNWMMKLGGIALLATAVVCFKGLRVGLLLDGVVAIACGSIMLACALCWFVYEKGIDINTILVVVFGVMFMGAGLRSYRDYASGDSGPAAPKEGLTTPLIPVAKPIHPASLHPISLPKDGEPPPPDGYLAALAKEDEKPPTASYE